MNIKDKKIAIEVDFSSIAKGVLFILLLAGLYLVRDIIAVLLFSIVIASAIEPASNWFEKRHIPRVLSVIFIYLSGFLVLGMIFYLIVPNFVSEVANFARDLPSYLQTSKDWQTFFGLLPNLPESISNTLQTFLLGLQQKFASFASGFFQASARIFGGALSLILIIVFSFYLSVQRRGLENFIRIITPARYENYILSLWLRSRKKIGRWLQGQILLGVLVGVLAYLGLSILRIKYALSFAILAAVFELIPIFGPIMSAIPPVAVAFLQSPSLALAVVVLYIIIQQFENHLIYPLVVRKIIGIHPVVSILALIIGGKLGGFFGILLAIPIATTLIEFLNDIAEKKHIY